MINHFKAEFYKLRHSKILITILGVCAAVIMVSFALGDMTFFGAGDGTESVIGFQAKCYLSSEIPTFQTVARSSLAYTAFFWIIGILFATIFFTKEYNTGTIKLSVAYGTKRTILYYTKAITILVVSLITYLIFVATFFVIEIIQSGYIPTASEVINLLGWALACGTVLLALESISIFLCVVIQNTGIVTGICCLYVLERFYVADVSRSNGTSGQGLYIVKKLLLMMNCTNPIIEIHDHNFMITIDFSPLLIKK